MTNINLNNTLQYFILQYSPSISQACIDIELGQAISFFQLYLIFIMMSDRLISYLYEILPILYPIAAPAMRAPVAIATELGVISTILIILIII